VEWRKCLVVLRVFDGALKGSAKTQAKALRASATLEHNGLGDNEDLVERADSMTRPRSLSGSSSGYGSYTFLG
jgi:hypothetical protein